MHIETPHRRVRVLVADDSAEVRRGLSLLFAAHPDIELVGTAADGREAHLRAVVLRPDIVVMDLLMPGVDGLQATREITAALPATRVVVLTSSSDRALHARAREAGAASTVLKDAHPSELLTRIRAAASRGGAR